MYLKTCHLDLGLESTYCAFKIACLEAPTINTEYLINDWKCGDHSKKFTLQKECTKHNDEERKYKFLATTPMLVSFWLYCLHANKCFILQENLAKLKYSASCDVNTRFQQFILAVRQHGLDNNIVCVYVHHHTHIYINFQIKKKWLGLW